MAPLPKRKHSKARKGARILARQHEAANAIPNLVVCTECGKMKRSHRVCMYCGK